MSPGIARWIAAEYPEFACVALGRSGATLLLEALRQAARPRMVVPAFICPEIPAMAAVAGIDIVHVDVDPQTLHPTLDRLETELAREAPSSTVLLIDHAFGYVMPEVASLRSKYPGLLIVEDCVRALGASVGGRPVGSIGDWALFSMYKTTAGNDHGALLLTRTPYRFSAAPIARTTAREWASALPPLRWAHRALKRYRTEYHAASGIPGMPAWQEVPGLPSRRAVARFERQLESRVADQEARSAAAREISASLSGIPSVTWIQTAPDSVGAAYYLTFTVDEPGRRDRLVTSLHRQGLFLVWAWHVVPALFAGLADTFPHGASNSLFLAAHVCHVPLADYVSAGRRQALIRAIRREVSG